MGFLDRFFGKKPENVPSEQQEPLPESWPYELAEVPPDKALRTWAALRQEGAGKFLPVIHGNRWEFGKMAEAAGLNEDSVDVILERGRSASFSAFMDKVVAMAPEIYADPDLGEWPKEAATPYEVFALTAPAPGKTAIIGKVPTSQSWELPGFLKFGSWNDCPWPEEHMAAFRHWEELYGAEIVVVTHDTIECRVRNRPKDKDSALALAKEQYIYCPDIVDQGVGSISALAAVLMVSDSWYFWWD